MTTLERATTTRPLGPTHAGVSSWWWRPPVFCAGFAAIIATLYLGGRGVYLDANTADDRKALGPADARRVILLGTSHGHDLNLPEAGFVGADLTHGGQDLFEMAYMARTVRRRAPELETVIISLSYFSFVFDNAAYVADGVKTRVGRRIDLYAGYGRLDLLPGDGAEYLKGLLYPVVTEDHYRAGFQGLGALLSGATTDAGARAAPADTPARAKKRSAAWYAQHTKRRCKMFMEYAKNMSAHHPGLAQDTLQSTLELTRELRAAAVRVLFFTPPYQRAYNACFDSEYQEQTRANGLVLASVSGTPYLDFSHDPAFVDRAELFEDADHLNEQGRVEFSRVFRQELAARSR